MVQKRRGGAHLHVSYTKGIAAKHRTSIIKVANLGKTSPRPLKKVPFDTTGFLGAQNLTQEQRDLRQNLYDNRSKGQCFEAICRHITAV